MLRFQVFFNSFSNNQRGSSLSLFLQYFQTCHNSHLHLTNRRAFEQTRSRLCFTIVFLSYRRNAAMILSVKFFQCFSFLCGFVIGTFPLLKRVCFSFDHSVGQGKFIHFENTANFKVLSSDGLYDESLAEDLFQEVKILCWVFTHPENHNEKAIHVKNLWGKRCNKLLFISSAEDPVLGTVKVPLNDGREFLWNKTVETYKYVRFGWGKSMKFRNIVGILGARSSFGRC
jgi:hypothetical protein